MDATTAATAITAMSRAQRWSEALPLVQDLVARGVADETPHALTAAANAAAGAGDCDLALEVKRLTRSSRHAYT